jgi:hypothetical protein
MYILSDLHLSNASSNGYLKPANLEDGVDSEYTLLHTYKGLLYSKPNDIRLIDKENITDFNHNITIYFENYKQDNADIHYINIPSTCTTEIMINRWYDFCNDNNLCVNNDKIKIKFISELLELYSIKDKETKEEYKLYIRLSIIEDNLEHSDIETIEDGITIINDPNFKEKLYNIDLYIKKC